MLKKFISFFWSSILLTTNNGFSQNETLQKFVPAPYGFSKLGAVKGIAGIIGDNYYIIESDYGALFDFKNNIRTTIAVFSINNKKFIRRFDLNALVAPSKKESDKLLFCDVIAWKDKIVGFYTHKNSTARNFLASAVVCNSEGKLIKSDIGIGDFQHDYLSGSFLWQGGLLINGRNTLSVVKDFQYRMTPDSSTLVVLCSPPTTGPGNVKFKLYDNDLNHKKEVIVTVPIKGKIADLVDFAMDNSGFLYLLTKSYKSKSERKKISDDDDNEIELHVINTIDNNAIHSLPVSIGGKTINAANLILEKDNQLYCFGQYRDDGGKKSAVIINGVFSAWLNPSDRSLLLKSTYNIPESVVEEVSYTGGPKNKKGIEDKYGLYQAITDNNGGMYVVMSNEAVIIFVRGETGAMNKYLEITRGMLVTYIDKDKKIKWTTGLLDLSKNPEMATRTDRFMFFEHKQNLLCAFVSSGMIGKEPQSLYTRTFNKDNGKSVTSTKIIGSIPPDYNGYKTVEKSLLPLSNGDYILTLVGDKLGCIKFKAE